MPLPDFDSRGDLPVGLHRANLTEVAERFGQSNTARQGFMELLTNVHARVKGTDKLLRFIVFGRFVTDKEEPRDIDVVLVMSDDFSLNACDEECRVLFDHQRAEDEIGASIFWVCPNAIFREPLEDFLLGWGTKRDRTCRGIVEVIDDRQ